MFVRRSLLTTLGAIAGLTGLPDSAPGQDRQPAEDIGIVDIEVSCTTAVRERFNRAVALLHHMTYTDAHAEFSAIADADPTCAMAYWGMAMTLFQPLWPTRPGAADLERGWQIVQTAREIGSTSPRERLFIASTAGFFDPSLSDYWERVRHWADTLRVLHETHPDDVEAKAFRALSLLAIAPPSGDQSQHVAAAEMLDEILRVRPQHPGAIHYTIHANDAAGREAESLDVTRRYAATAPHNPHALHMPTHIFVRLGMWREAIDGNRRAAAAALDHPAGDRQQWVWDEFPHALEYVVYALLQIGDDAGAMAAMTQLRQTPALQPSFKTAFHLSSIPARYALERRDWTEAGRIEPRTPATLAWDAFPWPESVTWFARGVGAARSGDIDAAGRAESRIAELKAASGRLGEDLFSLQTEILRLGVAAWTAFASGHADEAVRLMRDATALEATTPKPPVTPAPILPAAEMLGDMLLLLERPAEALEAYRSSLESSPRRFNSLAGAARAARAAGDAALARDYYRKLLDLAAADSPRPELREAASFLNR